MCLNAKGGGGRIDAESETFVAHSLRAEGHDASEDGTGRGTPLVPVIAPCLTGNYAKQPDNSDTSAGPMLVPIAWDEEINAHVDISGAVIRGGDGGRHAGVMAFAQNSRDEVRLLNGDGSIAGALAAESGMKQTTYVAVGKAKEGVMTLAIRGRGDSTDLEARADGTANALLTPNGGRGGIGVGAVAYSIQAGATRENPESGPDGVGVQADVAYTIEARQEVQAVAHMAVRRLTPVECERLQGFPDNYTNIPGAADGPRYKALGNSFAVPVVAWIGRRIKEAYAND
jgi:DNA (cytosine-5)-methyltransferase 1